MKITHTIGIGLVVLVSSCSSNKSVNYLVGTYTDNTSQGINIVNFNAETKSLALNSVVSGIENPSFVIANKTKTVIVAVEETASETGGKVTSFSYDKNTNSFHKLSSFATNGNHPCTVAFSPDENFVLVGNYSGGNLSVFP